MGRAKRQSMATYFGAFLTRLASTPMAAKLAMATVPAATATMTATMMSRSYEVLQVDRMTEAELGILFRELDTDGNGYLDRDEIQAGLAKRGLQIGTCVANALVSSFDINSDGLVSQEEFAQLAIGASMACRGKTALKMGGMSKEELKQLFKEIDTDGNGYLDEAEIQAALASHGLEVGLSMASALISTVDANHDGMLSEEEFIALASK